MVTKMFAVFDSKAKCYGVPFFFAATGLAVRAFTELTNDEKSTICKYPADFSLHEIGVFDDATGEVAKLEQQINLGLASAFLVSKEVPPALAGQRVSPAGNGLRK